MEDTYKYRFIVSKSHKLHRALENILDYARERSMATYRISLSEVDQYIKRLSDVSIPTPEEIGSIPISPLMEVTEYFMYGVVVKDSNNIIFEFHTEPLKTSYVDIISLNGKWGNEVAGKMATLCAHKVLVPSEEMDDIPIHVQNTIEAARHAKREDEKL